ncbi:MAG: hypothetical protein ACXAEU_07920 [Candidatus Hodarchaeales archaeon]|jgi:predicted transport protein
MSFLTKFIGKFSRGRADDLLLRGHDAFSVKDYISAYKYFMKASKAFYDNRRMVITSLTNAGIAAENLGYNEETASIYYQVSRLKAGERHSIHEIKESLEKARYFTKRIESSNYSRVLVLAFLFSLASQDVSSAKKIIKEAKKQQEVSSDSYLQFISAVWEIFNAKGTYVEKISFPDVKIPKEFQFITLVAEEICQANASLAVMLELPEGSPEKIKTGDKLRILAIIEPFAPVKILGYQLSPGNKGIIIKNPEGTFKKQELSKKELEFVLEPQLTGKWVIGPLSLDYQLGKFNFRQQSNFLDIEVEQAEARLKVETSVACIDEDFEYDLITSITNLGKGQLENVVINIKLPMGVKITSGTIKKIIAFLQPKEVWTFTSRLEFDISAFTTGHEIKIMAEYADKEQATSIVIGGTGDSQDGE